MATKLLITIALTASLFALAAVSVSAVKSKSKVANSCSVSANRGGNCPVSSPKRHEHTHSDVGSPRDTFDEWCGSDGPCAHACPVPPNYSRQCVEFQNATLHCYCNDELVLEGVSDGDGNDPGEPEDGGNGNCNCNCNCNYNNNYGLPGK